jgi:hypothetical protein
VTYLCANGAKVHILLESNSQNSLLPFVVKSPAGQSEKKAKGQRKGQGEITFLFEVLSPGLCIRFACERSLKKFPYSHCGKKAQTLLEDVQNSKFSQILTIISLALPFFDVFLCPAIEVYERSGNNKYGGFGYQIY